MNVRLQGGYGKTVHGLRKRKRRGLTVTLCGCVVCLDCFWADEETTDAVTCKRCLARREKR